MSEMEQKPMEPIEPASGPQEQSWLPPAPSEPPPMQYWGTPPPAPPTNSFWHRLAAGLVLAAVIAAAAGVGVGFSLARVIDGRQAAQNNQQAQSSNQAISPQTSNGGSLNASAIASKVDPALVDVNTVIGGGQAAGTGMIITSSGEVLTNNHVIDGSTSIQVTVVGRGQSYAAHLIATDPSADVALIQIEGVSGLPTVSFANSSTLHVGDTVVAIGNALGRGGAPNVSQGSVTALDQTITASEGGGSSEQLTGMIESDAVIYQGDSGGALVNSSGQVVGMITAGQAQGFRSSASSVGYAIAADTALSVVNRIRAGEQAGDLIYGQVGYLGVSVETLDSATAAQLGLNVSAGALVRRVLAGQPAEKAGIAAGSVITNVGGSAVTDTATLGTAVKSHKAGDRVSITWVNESGTHNATVTLGGVN
ncbi:MAG TPA: trypsin-like peptidase domain-containing protein [Candidatus Dormibacteraeota bacterium]|nr:trypsin-like peptidase domain-containing protein [Candidatus Dormibacteraeota bacterium]